MINAKSQKRNLFPLFSIIGTILIMNAILGDDETVK